MKKLLITLALAVASVSVFAQNESVALPFTRINQNSVAAGMGGAYLASTSAQGYFANPAMLTFTETKGDIDFGWQSWNPSETNYLNFDGAFCFNQRFSLSIGASYGIGAEYEALSAVDADPETYRTYDFIIGAGLGYKIGKYIALGANFRYANEALSEDTKMGTVGVDVFVSAHIKGFSVTAAMNNLGGKISSQNNASYKYSMPSSVDLGIGYDKTFGGKHEIEILADGGYYFFGDFSASAGAAYTWNKLLSVRGGYHYGNLIPSYGSLGLGVSVLGIHLDAAYLISGTDSLIGNTFALSLGYRF